MLRSTFAGFQTASSALRVNQNLLDVVGQNLSNVNTVGFSRQRLDINSVSINTNNLKYGTNGSVIGQGVRVSGISHYRDSFLDLRYRVESAKVGTENVQGSALSDLESILDEIRNDGLDAQFSDLIGQFQSLTSNPSDPVIEGVVRASASMLTQMFNNNSVRMNIVREQQTNYLVDGAVGDTNKLLKNIAELNKQIRDDNISGNLSLELNDKRNMLIDELSSYFNIEVNLTPVSIGGNKTIDELSVKLKNKDGINFLDLVDNDKYAKIEVLGANTDLTEIIVKNIDTTESDTNITNIIDKGQFAGYLNILNGMGEYATSGDNSYKGVQYYEKMLDTLASKFAEMMNEANKGPDLANKFLFTARGTNPENADNITALNIKISDDWANASGSYITNTKKAEDAITGDLSGATDNILYMISLFQKKVTYTVDGTAAGKGLFTGKIQEFLSHTTTNLSLQVADTQNSNDIYSEAQFQIDYSRNSMSSVDLDEEGVNLLTFSKSYSAAARLMTTLDEMLDTLINRMGI